MGDLWGKGLTLVLRQLIDKFGATMDGNFGDIDGIDEFAQDLVHLNTREGGVADLEEIISFCNFSPSNYSHTFM